MERPPEDLHCELCGHTFVLGDKVYILRLAFFCKDVCEECKNKVVSFAESIKPKAIMAAL